MLTIAHRGASAYAPENTRAAFELAIEMRADMIETDVHWTRDGEMVLFHDDLVDRTSDGIGPVADHTMAEMRALDLGAWFGAEFAGERVMTLREALDGFLTRIPLCVEIKDPLAAAPLADALGTADIRDRVQVTSFSWSALLTAKAIAPRLTLGFLARAFNDDIIRRCAERGFAQVCPPVGTLESALVVRAHERGLVVRAWGIRERSDIDRLFATGADGATTNWPDWITDRG